MDLASMEQLMTGVLGIGCGLLWGILIGAQINESSHDRAARSAQREQVPGDLPLPPPGKHIGRWPA